LKKIISSIFRVEKEHKPGKVVTGTDAMNEGI
jgi:hypothetical protein